MDVFKPDLSTYNKQRAAAGATNTSSALIASSSSSSALAASEDLYRDANSFVYADHKPSDDAIDRVIGKINIECVCLRRTGNEGTVLIVSTQSLDKRQKRSRERKNEVEGDITYINEKVRIVSPSLRDLRWSCVTSIPLLTSNSSRRTSTSTRSSSGTTMCIRKRRGTTSSGVRSFPFSTVARS